MLVSLFLNFAEVYRSGRRKLGTIFSTLDIDFAAWPARFRTGFVNCFAAFLVDVIFSVSFRYINFPHNKAAQHLKTHPAYAAHGAYVYWDLEALHGVCPGVASKYFEVYAQHYNLTGRSLERGARLWNPSPAPRVMNAHLKRPPELAFRCRSRRPTDLAKSTHPKVRRLGRHKKEGI